MGFLFNYNFDVRILEKEDGNAFFSTGGKEILTICSDLSLFRRNPLCVCADPFLFVKNGYLYLFYEYQRRHHGKGELHMRRTSDLENWSEDTCVLEEGFHLSFPNVFESGGQVFMIPESGKDGSIRLYKAEDDSLTSWRMYRTIISDGQLWADSDIVEKDGLFYLFTSVNSRHSGVARLFVSDSLDGEFKEHPCSPISCDLSTARNAGKIFTCGGDMFRPVQDCSAGYGKQISVMKIDALSPDGYRESVAYRHIVSTERQFYRWGGHQFNPVRFNGKLLVATDAKKRNYNIPDYLYGCCHHFCQRRRP